MTTTIDGNSGGTAITTTTGVSTLTSLAALKALTFPAGNATVSTQYRATAGDGGEGVWAWRSGNQSSNVSIDSLSGLWAAPNSDPTGASGAWQRLYVGLASLLWFGADKTGVADSAPAFAAAATAGLGTCYVPAGTYYWNSSQTFTKPCLFVGAGWNERNSSPATAKQGTWIYQDNAAITPVTVNTGGSSGAGTFGFENIAFEQAHPTPGVGWAPTVYNPFITINATAGGYFHNIYPYNIYAFCSVPGTSGVAGRIHFGYVQGQFLRYFFSGTRLLDVIRFDTVHAWPFWSNDSNVRSWVRANGEVITTARCDGMHINSIFAIGYKSVFTLGSDAYGVTTNCQIGTLYSDFNVQAMLITGDNTTVHIANLTTHGQGVANSNGLYITAAAAVVNIANFRMQSAEQSATYQGSTTVGSKIAISNMFITEFNLSNGGYTCFTQAATSSTPNTVSLANYPNLGLVTNYTNLINASNSSNFFILAGEFRTNERTVASLPAASLAGAQGRSYVTDATATTFQSIVAGGGSNKVPVYSDGTNWRIG